MTTLYLTCPICNQPDLEVNATIVHDTQGEPPYTAPLTLLDDYWIDWEASGDHERCTPIYECLSDFIVYDTYPIDVTGKLADHIIKMRALIEAFEGRIADAAITKESEGPDID